MSWPVFSDWMRSWSALVGKDGPVEVRGTGLDIRDFHIYLEALRMNDGCILPCYGGKLLGLSWSMRSNRETHFPEYTLITILVCFFWNRLHLSRLLHFRLLEFWWFSPWLNFDVEMNVLIVYFHVVVLSVCLLLYSSRRTRTNMKLMRWEREQIHLCEFLKYSVACMRTKHRTLESLQICTFRHSIRPDFSNFHRRRVRDLSM